MISFALLTLYVALIIVRVHEYSPATATMPILSTVLVLTFIAWIFDTRKKFALPQYWLMLALWACVFISILLTGWLGGAGRAFVDFGPIVLLFFMASTILNTLTRINRFLGVLLLCSMVLAVHGYFQSVNEIGWSGAKLSQGTRITYLGFLNDPNDLAMVFLMAAPIAAGWVLFSRGIITKLLGLVGLVSMFGAIYLTNSRGAIVGLIAQMAVFGYMRFKLAKSLLLVPILIVGLLAIAPSRFTNANESDQESSASRIESWFEGLQMLKSRPLFGVGKDAFLDHHWLTAHNSFVLSFAELGVIGYFFWLSLIVLSGAVLWRISKLAIRPAVDQAPLPGARKMAVQTEMASDVRLRDVTTVIAASFVGFVVSAFFLSRSFIVLLYLLLALATALYQTALVLRPDMPALQFRKWLPKLIGFELGSIAFVWLVVKVMTGRL